MSRLLPALIRLQGRRLRPAFEACTRDPRAAQERLLADLVSGNAATAFGQAHGFASIRSAADYARRVPVRDYEGLRPWIDRLLAGERAVLTRQEPFMFATTSGTTSRPKLIPITRSWIRELGNLTRLWLYSCLRDHPGLFDGKAVSFVSPATEGYTERGLPFGSVTGLTYCNVPAMLRRSYAVPYPVSLVTNYEDRYAIAARFMSAADASVMVVPNPTTFVRLAEVTANRAEVIVSAVHDGRLGVEPPDPSACPEAAAQAELYRELASRLRPDPARARALEACIAEAGRLRPKEAWPNLAMIGCWLGGSAGVQSRRIAEHYGEVPMRDLGYRATETTVTVPVDDGTASGVPALSTNFYEYVHEDEIDAENPRTLLAHELEEGGHYYQLLTTSSGLYRYDINDVVEVQGSYHKAPLLAFERKGREMANITGEKLHSAQVAKALDGAAAGTGMAVVALQLIPDPVASRYDLLVELEHPESTGLDLFSAAFDRHLAKQNIEYEQKRKSKRLQPCRTWRMRCGWSARRQRADVEKRGKRDTQYKWPILERKWDDETRAEVMASTCEGDSPAPPWGHKTGRRSDVADLAPGAFPAPPHHSGASMRR